MNYHQEFDFSFMAARMRPLFEKVEQTATAGANDAVNFAAMSASVRRAYAAATIKRIDALTADMVALAARRAELQELLDEQCNEQDEAA